MNSRLAAHLSPNEVVAVSVSIRHHLGLDSLLWDRLLPQLIQLPPSTRGPDTDLLDRIEAIVFDDIDHLDPARPEVAKEFAEMLIAFRWLRLLRGDNRAAMATVLREATMSCINEKRMDRLRLMLTALEQPEVSTFALAPGTAESVH